MILLHIWFNSYLVLSVKVWADLRSDTCIICIWQEFNIWNTKKQSRFCCFSGWSWTTRWQFPIYKQGLSLPVCSCPAAVSSTVEARICPCVFSATQMLELPTRVALGQWPTRIYSFALLNDNRRNFHEHPYGCYILNPGLIDKRGSPCYILLTQNFTRKKAFWGPFPNNSFRPPFFSGNLS